MKIMIINPTSTEAFAVKNLDAGKAVAAQGTEILSATPETAPASIEGHYDEAIATIGILEQVQAGEREGVDGYVIACFGDPGVLAAREAARGPVIGIAEAAMRVACMIATRFSVVTTLARTKIIAEHLVVQNGFQHQCAKIRATDLEVLTLEQSDQGTRQAIIEESRKAVEEDEVGAIVLGCAGMADLVDEVSKAVGVPVVEGVTAAVKLAESIVALGLGTSKHGDLAYPLIKPYSGTLAYLSPMAGPRDPRLGAE